MIRHLSRKHQVHVISLARSPAEIRDGAGIAPYCQSYTMAPVHEWAQLARMVARLPTRSPSSFGYFFTPDIERHVREVLRRECFDLIFVHCSSVAPYVEHVDCVPKILDFGDMDSQKWFEYAHHKPFPMSLGYRLEGAKLERTERRLATRFDVCTTTTKAELEVLEGFDTGAVTDWFPNGVDSEYFAPSIGEYERDTIAFVGRMDYYPNQECMTQFCEQTFPLLRGARPTLRLLIIGANPTPMVLRLSRHPGVTVTGSVPDVRPWLARAALMVAPLNIARGTQNKILEAMAMGIPVVASGVAAGGVDAVPGEHFVVASKPAEFAAAILGVLDDPSERERLSRAGRARMLSNHAWGASMSRLDAIIERCLERRTSRSRTTSEIA